jgi:hypothetical protein
MFSRQGVCSGCKEHTGISIHPVGFGQENSSGTGATSNTDWACQGDERNVGCIQIVEPEPSICFFALCGKILVLNCHGGCCDCKGFIVFQCIQRGIGQGRPSATRTTSNTDWACQGDERNVGCTQIVETELSTLFPCFLRQDSRVELPRWLL